MFKRRLSPFVLPNKGQTQTQRPPPGIPRFLETHHLSLESFSRERLASLESATLPYLFFLSNSPHSLAEARGSVAPPGD